jgi:hypothetical protein
VRSPELLLSGCRPFAVGKMSVKNFALCTPGDVAAGRYAEGFRELSFPAALALHVAAGEEAVEHGLMGRARCRFPSALSSPAPLPPLHRIVGGKFPLNRATSTMELGSRVRAA